jgi:hypothetical protein
MKHEFNTVHSAMVSSNIPKQNLITYLDLKTEKINKKLYLGTFRKPTFLDAVTNENSNHPIEHEMAVLCSMLYRITYI